MTGAGVQIDGPLAPFAAGFGESLATAGFSRHRARHLMNLMAEVSVWLAVAGRGAGDLTAEVIDEFFAGRRPSLVRCRTVRSFRPILLHLRSIGVVAASPCRVAGRNDTEIELLDSFRRWCIAQRGLTVLTTDQYVTRVAKFLALWRSERQVVVAELDGGAILATIREAADAMSRPSLRCVKGA